MTAVVDGDKGLVHPAVLPLPLDAVPLTVTILAKTATETQVDCVMMMNGIRTPINGT